MVAYVAGRNCDGCTMCCKIMGVQEIDKAPWQWCKHCDASAGCRIYEERPGECRTFNCHYLLDPSVGEHWKPSRSKMILTKDGNLKHYAVRVDSTRKHAWRQEPYYSEIKRWAQAAWREKLALIVWQGNVAIALLPQGEKNLGPVSEGQVIVTQKKRGATGLMLDAKLVSRR